MWGWGHHAQETPCDLGTSWSGEPRGHHGQENPGATTARRTRGAWGLQGRGGGVTTLRRPHVTLGHRGEENPGATMVRRTQPSWSHHRQEKPRGLGWQGHGRWGHHGQETPKVLGPSWPGDTRPIMTRRTQPTWTHHSQETPKVLGPLRPGDTRATRARRTQPTWIHHAEKTPKGLGATMAR